jgi:hypothetical protein
MLVLMIAMGLSQWGCEFIGGATVGAGATGAGYEYNAYRQMQKLEEDQSSINIRGFVPRIFVTCGFVYSNPLNQKEGIYVTGIQKVNSDVGTSVLHDGLPSNDR